MENKGVYFSASISSGLRLFERMHNYGETDSNIYKEKYKVDYDLNVFNKNIEHLNLIADKLQSFNTLEGDSSSISYINPAKLLKFMVNFDDTSYLDICKVVLEKYSNTVVVCDDWYLSYGCLAEVLLSEQRSIPIYIYSSATHVSYQPSVTEIIAHIDLGVAYLNSRNIDSSYFENKKVEIEKTILKN